MRRAFVIGLIGVLLVGGTLVALGAGSDPAGKQYKIVFDSAFGLTPGADFKVAGVPVGSIKDLDVRRSDARALITVEVSKAGDGFGGLRDSATCTINPQSLIGEYFVDCQPGKTGDLLPSGATIDVKRTTSPIPPDLVVDIMRRPVAERFSIIFSQLGVGFAARGGDINETIRRALPALQSTDRVLETLAQRRQTLADLARESGQVMKVLGARHEDVTDFISEAQKAASATADRREAVAETFRRFPGFLDQLTPTMRDLGTASRQMAPALADLRAAAPSVTGLLNTLRPFSQATLPAVRGLGAASKSGTVASREALSLIDRLSGLGQAAPEPSKNLRIVLDHLENRKFAVEKDPDSPGGAGYTGLEAPLQYVYDQSLAANIFDQRGYALKINLSAGECGGYTDAQNVRDDPGKYERCNQNLGPTQPGINAPDPSGATTRSAPADRRARRRAQQPGATATPTAPAAATPAPDGTTPGPLLGLQPVQDLIDQTRGVLPRGNDPVGTANDLLDFLLRP
jgi:virulence factor Mce-like protein